MAIIIGKAKGSALYGADGENTQTEIKVPNVPAFTAPTIGFGQGSLDAVVAKIGSADNKIYFGHTDSGEGVVVANGNLVSSKVLKAEYTAPTETVKEGTFKVTYLADDNTVKVMSIPCAGAEQVAAALAEAKAYADTVSTTARTEA